VIDLLLTNELVRVRKEWTQAIRTTDQEIGDKENHGGEEREEKWQ